MAFGHVHVAGAFEIVEHGCCSDAGLEEWVLLVRFAENVDGEVWA